MVPCRYCGCEIVPCTKPCIWDTRIWDTRIWDTCLPEGMCKGWMHFTGAHVCVFPLAANSRWAGHSAEPAIVQTINNKERINMKFSLLLNQLLSRLFLSLLLSLPLYSQAPASKPVINTPDKAEKKIANSITPEIWEKNFGEKNKFRIGQGEHYFSRAGYKFFLVTPWPVDWLYSQLLYIQEVKGVYYLCNPIYPKNLVELSIKN